MFTDRLLTTRAAVRQAEELRSLLGLLLLDQKYSSQSLLWLRVALTDFILETEQPRLLTGIQPSDNEAANAS